VNAGETAADAEVADCAGRTAMPGLIDAHVHLTFGALSQAQMLSPDMTLAVAEEAAAAEAGTMLLRGFTSVR
jgi:imidazolonepropionase-like amidohydrolase